MNRLYVVEPTPTVTGSTADHRLPLRASTMWKFLRGRSPRSWGWAVAQHFRSAEKWLDAVAADLQKHRGVFAGGGRANSKVRKCMRWRTRLTRRWETPESTVYYTEPVEAQPVNHLQSITDLCADMDAGKVDLLLILGGIRSTTRRKILILYRRLRKCTIACT